MTVRRTLGRLAAILALAGSAGGLLVASPADAATLEYQRVAGADRYETAANLATAIYNPGMGAAFVATGRDFADAMAAGAAAGFLESPLLLTEPDVLPPATAVALTQLQPENIIIVGGTAAVSDAVAAQLQDLLPDTGKVVRRAGADRYATAIDLANYVFKDEVVEKVYLATGTNFPDALAAGGAAGADGAPVLLTQPNDVPDTVLAAIDAIDPAEVVLLGGTTAISDAVKTEVETAAPTVRRAGPTRYDTAAALSSATFEVTGGHAAGGAIFLVNGTRFPDALASGAPAGAIPGPVLLTEKECIPKATNDEINRIAAALPADVELEVIVVGGFDVVGDLVVIDHKVCP
jgi:putative cell wall-binding protein